MTVIAFDGKTLAANVVGGSHVIQDHKLGQLPHGRAVQAPSPAGIHALDNPKHRLEGVANGGRATGLELHQRAADAHCSGRHACGRQVVSVAAAAIVDPQVVRVAGACQALQVGG